MKWSVNTRIQRLQLVDVFKKNGIKIEGNKEKEEQISKKEKEGKQKTEEREEMQTYAVGVTGPTIWLGM